MARTSRSLTCRDSKAPKPVRTTRSPAANDSRMLSSTAFSARSPEERVPLSLVATRKARSPFRSVANRHLLSDGAKSRAKPHRLREYSTRNRVQYAQRYLCTYILWVRCLVIPPFVEVVQRAVPGADGGCVRDGVGDVCLCQSDCVLHGLPWRWRLLWRMRRCSQCRAYWSFRRPRARIARFR